MLGIFLIYWLGKSFYELAEKFSKNKWGYTILGIVTFYSTSFFSGILFAIIDLTLGTSILELNDTLINLISLPFSLLGWWLMKIFLEKRWEKQIHFLSDEKIESFGKESKDQNKE